MKFTLNLNTKEVSSADCYVIGAYSKTETKGKKDVSTVVLTGWPKELKATFESMNSSADYTGSKGSTYSFNHYGSDVLVVGLGDKTKVTTEDIRKELAKAYKAVSKYKKVAVAFDTFTFKSKKEESLAILVEAFEMTAYKFDKYLSKSESAKLEEVILDSADKGTKKKAFQKAIKDAQHVAESVNVARDFVNEPPNVLRSTAYAKMVQKDVKDIPGVKCKIMGRKELQKENMNLFLSVNDGSAYDAQLVHLTYTPSKATKNTKHIAFVGKGLVFDTGGYSLKPGGSMMNMKFDMAGSATVFAAFRAAALMKLPVKITCILGMTDNAVNSKATMPDAIVKARNGKTVEILNTDAEGRLVMADCLDYACDLKPDALIDAATLTGACLIALGTEVCGLMSNDEKLASNLLKASKSADEYMWQLPIIPEWEKDMKGTISDLKNIGGSRWGGTAKAAAFLQEFIKNDVAWAHLDIAGVGDSQSHLPYCPSKGASGVIVRSLVEFLKQN
ncbi:leucyl aminopeptidase [Halobacteriovorax vibrionivorans]|uniref:Probable cytosol aminopeptidase n=1 Tax=Halobacteriovorax vibrionivorans TaxID=2152716 RepID=A0ABY0II85_9BACT|nr:MULTISPECIES: leucyl aminopeptidase [Halobacteriovorax]RZF22671.1 leucyl aminopeptidase [Halobacteriovorax vibrionivorans]TGD46692.1 leucyl aminopeptidase [Halobacteriovorax sp. Y22]